MPEEIRVITEIEEKLRGRLKTRWLSRVENEHLEDEDKHGRPQQVGRRGDMKFLLEM